MRKSVLSLVGMREGPQGVGRGGFTLLEMLTVLAALVVVLGLMISLSRNVRMQSAQAMTRRILVELSELSAVCFKGDEWPVVREVARGVDEEQLDRLAAGNNQDLIRALQASETGRAGLAKLSGSAFDGMNIRDAWGRPIVFVPPGAATVGLSPQWRAFFFSAGADGKYSTLDDNLYSYDQSSAVMVE